MSHLQPAYLADSYPLERQTIGITHCASWEIRLHKTLTYVAVEDCKPRLKNAMKANATDNANTYYTAHGGSWYILVLQLPHFRQRSPHLVLCLR